MPGNGKDDKFFKESISGVCVDNLWFKVNKLNYRLTKMICLGALDPLYILHAPINW